MVGTGLIDLLGLGVAAWAGWSLFVFARAVYLRRTGERRVGTVIAARSVAMNNKGSSYFMLLVMVQVVGTDGQVYQRRVRKRYDMANMPRPGDAIEVCVSRNNPAMFVAASAW